MKFKVGDKVRVREWDDMKAEFGLNCCDDIKTPIYYYINNMRQYCGKQTMIARVFDDSYRLSGCDIYKFTDDMLIPYEFDKFDKSDLKTGMVVETKNGNKYMVYGDRLVRSNYFNKLSCYDNDLKNKDNEDYDIIRCFDINSACINCIEDILNIIGGKKILWERKPEEKIISSDEALKILKEHYGCGVKIKGI